MLPYGSGGARAGRVRTAGDGFVGCRVPLGGWQSAGMSLTSIVLSSGRSIDLSDLRLSSTYGGMLEGCPCDIAWEELAGDHEL